MKEAIKVFLTILALLTGGFFLYDSRSKDSDEALAGIVLLAVGLTALWMRFGKKDSN